MELEQLFEAIEYHHVEPDAATQCVFSPSTTILDSSHYSNKDLRLGIDFHVQKLPFQGLQVMDPRLVVISPGACNEKHRHAHESIFVVLSGSAEIQIGQQIIPLGRGEVAYIPRWVVHQSRNQSDSEPLTLLAITDFGLTSAVLGDYDSRTRVKMGGIDTFTNDSQSR
jgi:mannose-6-phosphate isomerase-like protein (cupin superfamily)